MTTPSHPSSGASSRVSLTMPSARFADLGMQAVPSGLVGDHGEVGVMNHRGARITVGVLGAGMNYPEEIEGALSRATPISSEAIAGSDHRGVYLSIALLTLAAAALLS